MFTLTRAFAVANPRDESIGLGEPRNWSNSDAGLAVSRPFPLNAEQPLKLFLPRVYETPVRPSSNCTPV